MTATSAKTNDLPHDWVKNPKLHEVQGFVVGARAMIMKSIDLTAGATKGYSTIKAQTTIFV